MDDATHNAAISFIKSFYPSCKNFAAWNQPYSPEYFNCTNEIMKDSNKVVKENFDAIESFASNLNLETSIKIEFKKIQNKMDLEDDSKARLKFAIAHIKNAVISPTNLQNCFEDAECLKRIREIVLQLKSIEWGILGHRVSNIGSFIANHHSVLGPYFGDIGTVHKLGI